MSYNKISKEDILFRLIRISTDPLNCGRVCMNVVNLAHLLDTSKYQVRKHIKELRKEGLIELTMMPPQGYEDDVYPPYWGYCLTKKAIEMDIYKEEFNKNMKIFKSCFNI